jgi:hypothetical protein
MKIDIKITVRQYGIPSPEASAAFGKIFANRGYIVIGTVPGPKFELGQQLNQIFEYETARTFVVTEYTNRKDMIDQIKMMADMNPRWQRKPSSYVGATFYRIVPYAMRRRLETEKKALPTATIQKGLQRRKGKASAK